MKQFALVAVFALASCATEYQSQSFTGGYSEYKLAPDIAVVMFHGNAYTNAERVVMMCTLRCAEVTLQSGYHYFSALNFGDTSSRSSFTIPGTATTNVYGYGNYATANTVITPAQTVRLYKPSVALTIRMANDQQSLVSTGHSVFDAAFVSQSLKQYLGIKR
jgi:hypothetical protein